MAGRAGGERDERRTVRQRYGWWAGLRAYLYGRLPLFAESLVSLALLAAVIAVDIIALLNHSTKSGASDPASALSLALQILTFQSSIGPSGLGPALYFFNVFFALIFVQSLIVSTRAFFNKRPLETQQRGLAATCSGQVIVCGLGRVGLRVVTRLVEQGYCTVVVERNPAGEHVRRAREMGVPVLIGDARDPEMLRQAGIHRARALLAGIDNDLLNVDIALAARKERPGVRVILRAFNQDFDASLERTFGRHTAFSASALGAPTFAGAAVSRDLEHVLPLDGNLVGVAEVEVPSGQALPDSARELEAAYSVRVLRRVDRAGRAAGPKAANGLHAGDRLTLLGRLSALEAVRVKAATIPLPLQHPTADYDTVIVCGLGKVGYRVVHWLWEREPRPRIVVIHTGEGTTLFPEEVAQLDGVTTVIGDARNAQVLQQAGLDRAYAIAAVTSNDLVNLQVGLEARRLRPDVHVVLRVFGEALAENLVTFFGIHTAYSTSNLAAPTLAAATVQGGVSHAFFSGGAFFATDDAPCLKGDDLTGQSVEALRKRHGVIVAGLERGGAFTLLPDGEVTLAEGDRAYLVAELEAFAHLRHTT